MKLQGLAWILLGAAIGFHGCSSDKGGGGGGGGGGDEAETEEDTGQTETKLDPIDWGKVDFNFVSPKDTEDLKPGNVTIEIDTNLAAQGTWNLYYTTSFKSIDNAKPIKEDMKPSDKTIVWDTSKVEPSTYFLFATLHFGTQVNVRFFQGAITVEEEGADNRTPFISILTDFTESNNNRPSVLQQNTDRIVEWMMVEPDGEDVTMKVELSVDNGTTWEDLGLEGAIVPHETEENRFLVTWPIAGNQTISDLYRFRLVATDSAGKAGLAVTNNFGVTDVATVTFRNRVQTIFAGTCAVSGCHDAAGSGNLRLDYADNPFSGQQGARNRRDRINDRIHRAPGAEGFMPDSGSLTAVEKAQITMWWWQNGNNGSNTPNVQGQNYVGQTIRDDFPFTLSWSLDQIESDGTAGSTSVIVAFQENGGAFANIATGSYTEAANANGEDRDYSFDWTPGAVALGNGVIRVRADNGVGRIDGQEDTVRIVNLDDPQGATLRTHAEATADCAAIAGNNHTLPTLADLQGLEGQMADFAGTLDTVWTSEDDPDDASNAQTYDLDGGAAGADTDKTLTLHVLCIDG